MLSTGTGTATPPAWTPGGGDAAGFRVGVGNEFGTGVGPGVGLLAKAVEQTIDAPTIIAKILDSLIDFILFTPFPGRIVDYLIGRDGEMSD
jgi:hypothetical protein